MIKQRSALSVMEGLVLMAVLKLSSLALSSLEELSVFELSVLEQVGLTCMVAVEALPSVVEQ